MDFYKKWSHPINFFFVIAIVFLIYQKGMDNQFTNFDDNLLIEYQEDFFKGENVLIKSFTSDVFPTKLENDIYYRPILVLSFALDYKLGGLDPKIYHVSNLIYFILSLVILYMLLLHNWVKDNYILLFLVLLYATHPLFTGVVSWIPGRNASLLAIFGLSSFYFLIKYINGKKTSSTLVAHSLFLIIALFTKESAIMLIPLFALYVIFFGKNRLWQTQNIFLLLIWSIMAIIFLRLRNFALKDPFEGNFHVFNNIYENAIVLPNYIGKFILSTDLSNIPVIPDLNILVSLFGLSILVGLVYLSSRNKIAAFGLLWFLLLLLPGILFVNPNLEEAFHFEHRSYFPLVGIMLILGHYLQKISHYLHKYRFIFFGFFILLIAFQSYRTHERTHDYADPYSFFKSSYQNSPHCTICAASLANIYHKEGNNEKAVDLYLDAINEDSTNIELYTNLALIYLNSNQKEKAKSTIDKAYELEMDDYRKYMSLAEFFITVGNYKGASFMLTKAAEIRPYDEKIARMRKFIEQKTND